MPTSAYLTSISNPNHRLCSWDYCYGYFYENRGDILVGANLERSCLSLGVYLASWGMYRGSGPLLQCSHRAYINVIKWIAEQHYTRPYLWCFRFCDASEECLELLIAACDELREILTDEFKFLTVSDLDLLDLTEYDNVETKEKSIVPTDTLISKIMLGVFGCMPALDTRFVDGINKSKTQAKIGGPKISNAIKKDNLQKIQEVYKNDAEMQNYAEEHCIKTPIFVRDFPTGGYTKIRYTCAKIVDMYYWEEGKPKK